MESYGPDVILPEPPQASSRYPIETVGKRKNGDQLSLEASVTVAGEAPGTPHVLVLHDITRHKRIENALRRQATMLGSQVSG